MSRNFSFVPRSGFLGATAAAGEHRQPRSPQAPVAADIMSGRTISEGIDNRSPAYGARNTYRADPFKLAASKPSGSPASMAGLGRTLPRQDEGASFPPLPAESILKPANAIDALSEVSPTLAVAQATIDFLKVLFAILTVVVTGVGIAASFFYFLFC